MLSYLLAVLAACANATSSVGTLFTSWQLYGMIATGVLGMFLVQSALNAGRLLAAQPGLTLSDPVVSILWGVMVFYEQLRGGLFIVLSVISGLILAAAVVVLARSPPLSDESRQSRAQDRGAGAEPQPAQGAAAG